MKIGVVGLGHVGLVTALVLAKHGYEVTGISKDKKKSEMLAKGEPTLYEPGIEEMLKENLKMMIFSTDYGRLKDAEAIFIIVPTPTVNERIDLSYIREAMEGITKANKKGVVVIKSTVVPGTAKRFSGEFGRNIVSNPEFTKEGTGLEDTEHPNRIVIGSSDEKSGNLVESIWAFAKSSVVRTTNENAELIKYASNAFLATKISFMNEIANLCERIPGADVEVIAKAMGLDERIAPYFLKAGLGWGGSCFPKDTKAIASFGKELGERMSIIEAAIKVNDDRIGRTIELAKKAYNKNNSLMGVKVGVLGIAFKNNTDDTRDSQAVKLVNRLIEEKAEVGVYDPKAKIDAMDNVKVHKSKENCIKGSDIVIITTEWEEFADTNVLAKGKPIIDTRRIISSGSAKNLYAVGIG